MYIACPECDTNFMVLPEQIGPVGRKVKCSNCNQVWHQRLKENQVRMESIFTNDNKFIPIGDGVNLPALLPIKLSTYIYSLSSIITLMIILLCLILFQDKFNISLASNANDLYLSDVHADNISNINKLMVSYKIVNNSDYDIILPLVRIRLFDENKKLLESYLADQKEIKLTAGQQIQIKTEFISSLLLAKEVDITLGNKFDLVLR